MKDHIHFPKLSSIELSLEKILYQLQDGVITINRRGLITYINKAAQEIMERQIHYQPQIGDYFISLARPGRREITSKHIADAFCNQTTTLRVLYPQQGRDFWIELCYQPITEKDGLIRQVCIRARDVTEQELLERRLRREKQKSKLALNRVRLAAQDEERAVISQELHDNVNQVLTTVKLYNEIVLQDVTMSSELLNKSIQQINHCIETIRLLSRRLSTPLWKEMELPEALKDLAGAVSATKKVQVLFQGRSLEGVALDPSLKVTIYRIVQEQLTNILKYAEASRAEINLKRTAHSLLLKIRDDGKGFDLQHKRTGVGITNIIHRAETLGGSVRLQTSIGNGCLLIARFPMF